MLVSQAPKRGALYSPRLYDCGPRTGSKERAAATEASSGESHSEFTTKHKNIEKYFYDMMDCFRPR